MKSSNVIRKIGNSGLISIPKKIRQSLNLKKGDPIEFTIHGRDIHLRKHQESCVFCNTKNAIFIEHNGLNVCWSCARHLGHESER